MGLIYTLTHNVNRPYTLTHIIFIMPFTLTWNVSPKLYKHTTLIKPVLGILILKLKCTTLI